MNMKKLAIVTKVVLVSQYSHEEIQSFLDGCVLQGAKPMQGVAKLAADDYIDEVANTDDYLYVGVLSTPDPEIDNCTAFSNDLRDFLSPYQEAAMLGLMTAELCQNIDSMINTMGLSEAVGANEANEATESTCKPEGSTVH